MKKLVVAFIALALLVGAGIPAAFADANVVAYGGGLSLGTLRSVTLINTDTAGYDSTIISATYIPAGKCKLLGYHANAVATNDLEGLFDIRDTSTAAAGLDASIIAENEVTAALPAGEIFPLPLNISSGICVNQGPKTSVTIYYEQVLY